MKKTILGTAVAAMGVASVGASAATIQVTRMDFYPLGVASPSSVDTTIGASPAGASDMGIIDTTAGTGGFGSDVGPTYGTDGATDGFLGHHWVADVQAGFDGTGTFTWAGTSAAGEYSYTWTQTASQVGVGLYLDWYLSQDIPVLAVFDQLTPDVWTPVDTDGDGAPGTAININTAIQTAINGQTLAFSSSVSAVPIPAAVWLFGSAVLGMFGVGHHRKSVA